MPPKIKDQFSERAISRQRKWQLRQRAKGLCVVCGKEARSWACERHRLYNNVWQREKFHRKNPGARRNLAAKSYAEVPAP
jgi:hypothetical protein